MSLWIPVHVLATQLSAYSANSLEKLPETNQSSSVPLAISCKFVCYLASVFIWFHYTVWFLHTIFIVELVKMYSDPQLWVSVSIEPGESFWGFSTHFSSSEFPILDATICIFSHEKNKGNLGTNVMKPHQPCSSLFPAFPSPRPHPLWIWRQEELCVMLGMFLNPGTNRPKRESDPKV